jgi:sialic acid synthase SpsE
MNGKKLIKKISIITEIASTHNGSFSRLKKLINKSIEAKTDYLKFQIYKNKYLCHKTSKFYDGLKRIEISHEKWSKIIKIYKDKIKIILEPFDEVSYLFCKKFKNFIDLKISSSEHDNLHLIDDSLKNFKKVFFNISGKSKKELDYYLSRYNRYKKKLIFLYGYQSFPTKSENLRFGVLKYIQQKGFKVGYADHCATDTSLDTYIASLISIYHGAEYLEKHFTLDRFKKFPDYISSFEFDEFKNYINFFKFNMKNFNNLRLTADEKNYTNQMGKYAVLIKDKFKNQLLKKNDIIFLRTGDKGLKRSDLFIGNKNKKIYFKKNCKKNQILDKNQFKLIKY